MYEVITGSEGQATLVGVPAIKMGNEDVPVFEISKELVNNQLCESKFSKSFFWRELVWRCHISCVF